MHKLLRKVFNLHDIDSPEAIASGVHDIMMTLNNEFTVKAQNEIIRQVISNTIQIRELEIEQAQLRVKELNEGNVYLNSLLKN